MDTASTFGNELTEIMRRRYIAPVDVARELGVSPTLVGHWLRGEVLPRRKDVEHLAGLLGGADTQRLLKAAASCPEAVDVGDHPASSAPSDAESAGHPPPADAPSDPDADDLLELPAPFRAAFAAALARPYRDPFEAAG